MDQRKNANVLWFDELKREDVDLVGGKSSSLGELTSGTNYQFLMALQLQLQHIAIS